MKQTLENFINTLEELLKKNQQKYGSMDGFSKLTTNQLRYIDTIGKLKLASITQIAEELNFTKASVTIGVNKLIKLGYVLKSVSPKDRRFTEIKLSLVGQTMYETKQAAFNEFEKQISSILTTEEINQFNIIIDKLTTYFSHYNLGEE